MVEAQPGRGAWIGPHPQDEDERPFQTFGGVDGRDGDGVVTGHVGLALVVVDFFQLADEGDELGWLCTRRALRERTRETFELFEVRTGLRCTRLGRPAPILLEPG